MAFAADGAATPPPQRLRHSPSAATTFEGGSSVALAYGTSAANRAIATMIVSATQPGNARIAASASGAPSSARTPAPRATPPAAMATGTTGTMAQVGRGRDQGEPAERREDDRQRGRLRGKRHAEALGQPVGHASATEPTDSLTERRRPGDEARGREGRQLEACVGDQRRVGEQQQHDRPAECRRRTSRTPRLSREQDHAGHGRRANDRRRRSGEADVGDDREHRQDGAPAPPERAAERRDGGRDDRDVPAGDRDHVAHAGRREVRGELAVDAVAQPDQDPGREPRLGLGQDARERRRRVPAHGFQGCGRFDGSRFELEVVCADRAGHAGPLEVRAVWRVRAWLEPSVDGDPLAGRDDRVAGERRRESDGAVPRSASSIVAIWWPSRGAPVATTTACHGPSPSGSATASIGGGGRTARRTARAAAAHRTAAAAGT